MDEPERIVERLAELGTKYTAYPYPSGIDFSQAADIERVITSLDKAGTRLRNAGQTLTYHNHAHEFFRFQGTPVLEIIYARTNPENLKGELDTYRREEANLRNGVRASKTGCRCCI